MYQDLSGPPAVLLTFTANRLCMVGLLKVLGDVDYQCPEQETRHTMVLLAVHCVRLTTTVSNLNVVADLCSGGGFVGREGTHQR